MCRAEGGEEPTVAGLGSAPLGVVVLVVVCVGFLRRPVHLVTSERGLAWRPVVVVCWVTGLDGGAAGLGVQAGRVVWRAGLLGCCGCHRCRCADACGVVRGCVRAGLGFG